MIPEFLNFWWIQNSRKSSWILTQFWPNSDLKGSNGSVPRPIEPFNLGSNTGERGSAFARRRRTGCPPPGTRRSGSTPASHGRTFGARRSSHPGCGIATDNVYSPRFVRKEYGVCKKNFRVLVLGCFEIDFLQLDHSFWRITFVNIFDNTWQRVDCQIRKQLANIMKHSILAKLCPLLQL